MNKQLAKIDETISWLEENAPEDACVILMAMAENPSDDDHKSTVSEKSVEIKTYIEGYDEDLSGMLVKKMIQIPLLRQVLLEALGQVGVEPDFDGFLKWREKNKYDLKFEALDISESSVEPQEGEPEAYIRVIQEFCVWMNAKPSRNLTLLTLASDELNSERTTFAMGFAPDLSVMLAKELQENYGFRNIMESALIGLEAAATYEEYAAWKDFMKKKA
ncbi:MAG: hypothetical protein RR202_00720 [Bacteroidales bacterium]